MSEREPREIIPFSHELINTLKETDPNKLLTVEQRAALHSFIEDSYRARNESEVELRKLPLF